MVAPFRFGLILLYLFVLSQAASAATVVTIEPRPGVSLRMLVDVPPDARALAMLFPGGAGTVNIADDGSFEGMKGNFLTRTRDLFIADGIATALVDAPSDRLDRKGLTFEYRASEEHAKDIKQAIAKLRALYPKLSIWLVGTSRGSTSAANAATAAGPGEADGLVLTSSVGVASRHGGNVLDFKLEGITIPTLVVHHVDDGCGVTPVAGARDIKAHLTGAKASELITVEGGDSGNGKECGARSHHGYLGIEQKVVDAISAWIKSH
jgi:pimeloyl-ACP methyl ester carboxylesterase